MYRKILMPTDGSPTSDRALEQGLELARLMGAEVTFLHVLENPLSAGYSTPETLPYAAQLYQDLKDNAKSVLERALVRAQAAGVVASSQLVENRDPVQAITDVAKDFDAVVMGTHGRAGFNRWMFGSVAEGALRRSDKPFLMVRGSAEDEK